MILIITTLFIDQNYINISEATDKRILTLDDLIAQTGTYNYSDEITGEVALAALKRKGKTGQAIAFSIARDVLSRYQNVNGGRDWDAFINTILDDHAGLDDEEAKRVLSGDSYFRTNKKDKLKRIIEETVNNPDGYNYYSGQKCELELYKTFPEHEVQGLIGHRNLGKYKGEEKYANTALVCFGVSNERGTVNKPANERYWHGPSSMNTAYPKQ